ncbi:hypothetical protein GUJ93_ZPchr0012g22134 [Zizania palustris]|uniref:Uncharacterized protein n=1 Tax=Zizania palustris TaxID=103762 RepID=A0A8J5WMM9_ZIZPA|nr:hypothetical protein GUJ93_ZPchr0012g22134 [Zizania palustris]
MMEVEKPWELKEDADVMAAAAEEEGSLLTRGRNKRHTLELNGEEGGEGEGGGGEGQEAHEEHKSVFFDPTQVSEHFTEKDGKNEVTQVAQFIALKEKADETSSPKGKELDTQENVNVQETNGDDNISRLEKGSCTNGSHEVSSSGETATVANGTAELKLIAVIDENKRSLANSNGADHIDNGSMNRTNVPEIEAEKEEDTIMGKVNIEEYDLEKILDEQETHELFCPNCNSCITRRVILRKRKRTVRQTTRDEPPKKAQLAEPFANNSNQTVPERHEQESPDIFRCLSCFTFFIPTGIVWGHAVVLNIFRIFGRPEVNQEVQVHGPSASHEMSSSDSCGSWLLSCFEPADNPKKTDADPEKKPLLSDMQDSNGTTSVEASTTYVHSYSTTTKHEQSKKPLPAELSSDPQTSTKKKEDFTASLSESSVEAHSLPAASIVTPGQSETGFKHTAVTDVVTRHRDIVNQERIPLAKPGDAAQLDKQDVERTVTDSRAFTTTEIKFPDARPATLTPDVFSPVVCETIAISIPSEAVEPEAPPHLPVQTVTDAPMPVVHPASADQRDGWDILKAIVYGGLVESITSLSVVSAAASSGAVTCKKIKLFFSFLDFNCANELTCCWIDCSGHIHLGHSKSHRWTSNHLSQHRRPEDHRRCGRERRAGRPLLGAAREAVQVPAPRVHGRAVVHPLRPAAAGHLRAVLPRRRRRRRRREGEEDGGGGRRVAGVHRAAGRRQGAREDAAPEPELRQDRRLLPEHRRQLVGAVLLRRRAHHHAPGAPGPHRWSTCITITSCPSYHHLLP